MPTSDYLKRIRTELAGIINEWSYSSQEDAFVHFCLRLLPESDDDEACANAYTNGAADLGIDGILIIEGEINTIHFVQAKYGSPTSQIDRSQIKEFVDNVIRVLRDPDFSVTGNNSIIRLSRDSRDILRDAPDTKVVLSYYNFGKFTPNAIAELKGWRSRFHKEADFVKNFQLYDYDGKAVVEMFALNLLNAETPPDITLPIVGKQVFQFEKTVKLNGSETRVKSAVFTTTAESVGTLRNRNGRSLFSPNVRYSLGTSNEVNRGIERTLGESRERDKFWFYNNGVYATCNDFRVSKKKNSVDIKGIQVVNGCQTSTAFGEALSDELPLDQVEILMRLVAGKRARYQKLLENISKYTNTQNAVKARDLHSNDKVQDDLFDSFQLNSFFGKKYFYERKRGEMLHFSSTRPAMTRGRDKIDNKEAAQAFLAFVKLRPARAKASADILFRDNYTEIFDSSETRASNIFYPYFVSRIVKAFVRQQASTAGQEYLSQARSTLVAFVSHCFKEKFQTQNMDVLSEKFERMGEQEFVRHVNHYLQLAVQVLSDAAIAKYGKVPDQNFDSRKFFLDSDLFSTVIIPKIAVLGNVAGLGGKSLWAPPDEP